MIQPNLTSQPGVQAPRPIVHLFCNAHIDPVWMWSWEEGAREAVSTFHTAVNLLDEFPEFVFNHNESVLYEWVEEYDPPLFARIQELVREGRWNIVGGWYLQPDCNLPGGETLVRLILKGRRYFAEKFGMRPKVAYNFDTFGHPSSLPQLLRQSDFEMYIHCRPQAYQLDLPAALYCWEGVDGSQVMTLRPDSGWYGTPEPGQAYAQALKGIELARASGQDVLVTWGLGDHGGGATRHDLQALRTLLTEMANSDVEVRHSSPEAYLARLKAVSVAPPSHIGELQRTLAGCYTSVAPIKRSLRLGESMLASAERWSAIAWWRYGWAYPAQQLDEAWKRLMFNTFHDILAGTLVEEALPGVRDMFGYVQDVARRIIVKSQHALLPNIRPTPDTIPLYVFNPHATPLSGAIACNFLSAYAPPPKKRTFALYDDHGQRVPSQTGGGSPILADGTWQPHMAFVGTVDPLAVRRYEIRFEDAPSVDEPSALRVTEDEGGITLDTPFWTVSFDRASAAPARLLDKRANREVLTAPIQLFVMEDVGNAWGGEARAVFNVPISPFVALTGAEVGQYLGQEREGKTGPALRVLEYGAVWVKIECLVGWGYSRASICFTFYAELPHIDIDVRLHMQARRKMIKLAISCDLPGTQAICEIPYGATERTPDATEWSYARWIRLMGADYAVGVANNGQSGFDVSADGRLHLNISRGGVHSSWEGDVGAKPLDTAKSYTFMDQEQIDTRFRLVAGNDPQVLAEHLVSAALELNQPLERFFVYSPPTLPADAPADPAPFLAIEPATVVLGALKKAEAEDVLIVRLVETVGLATTATLHVDSARVSQIAFRPFEIKSFKLSRDQNKQGVSLQPCNLLEE